jgi:Lysyl oxidase
MRRFVSLLGALGCALLTAGAAAGGPAQLSSGAALYPDLRTVVPQHVQLVNAGQREILRFSNGIANTGAGPWALRPDPFPDDATPDTTTIAAVQEFRDANVYYRCGTQPKQVTTCYNVIAEQLAGQFEYHPAHNHWHIGDVALFEVRKGSPTGKIVGGNSIKTTFCLIDWYKLADNARTAERVFFDCYASYQGISSGWVDQYHQSTEGQQLDLTGVPDANDYYLVSTANYARVFTETDYANNTAWVKFRLYTDSNGNRKIEVTAHSPCTVGTGLCGEGTTNR